VGAYLQSKKGFDLINGVETVSMNKIIQNSQAQTLSLSERRKFKKLKKNIDKDWIFLKDI
jgi:hypothetical protein